MATGRLTHQDRQYIAARLAEGAAYAEIARHLTRPTSTISREVNRNGGPRRYRPELAQRATAARASRAGHAVTSTPPDAAGRDPAAVRRVRQRLTTMVMHTGLSRMASRVLTQLFTTDSGELTAAELASQLQVSPASVSKAVTDLERQGLLRRERDPRQRRDRYVVDDDVWVRAWLVSVQANLLLAETARHGAHALGSQTPAGARLRQTSDFLEQLTREMMRAAEHWRQAPPPAGARGQ